MANELVVVETIKEVSEAVKTIVGTYRETRIVRVTQKNILKERLKPIENCKEEMLFVKLVETILNR